MVPIHSLTSFEIQKYYQNESSFNGVYSGDKLSIKIQDGTYTIHLDKYADGGTHWTTLYVLNIEKIYFDSFGVEHVPKVIKKLLYIRT